jgi:large subunit ribosomal protein L25
MPAATSLEATVRAVDGTGAVRAVRRDDKVPAIVYGGAGEPVAVSLELRAVNRALNIVGLMSKTIDLNIEGKTEVVKLQDVQRHPVTEAPLHIDFLRVAG